jgi:type I restriction enzyme M protein
MPANHGDIESRLWSLADQLWANSNLRPAEFSTPVLGLIFLRYADQRFGEAEKKIGPVGASVPGGRRTISKTDYQAAGVLYLPPEARFAALQKLPEGADLAQALSNAMKAIEADNPDLKDVLPKDYRRLDKGVLIQLLRILGGIPMDIEGDAFGRIYEYFLTKFAQTEGKKGGEFFTPISIVQLIVGIIEPYHGRIYDPASGSGGMFVQSAAFVAQHKRAAASEISVYGQERVAETIRLAKMNLAVHGLAGDIRQGNTYYEDLHNSVGKFDFVMANPPFNVSGVDREKVKGDPRFAMGAPSTDNANYLWIQAFYHALNARGRAGFVMANSAADARGSELEIRKKLIQAGAVDVMASIGPNFFYTVTLPCTLWFLDRGKGLTSDKALIPERRDTILFLDARGIYQQVDRAHREFSAAQIEFLANIARLYRGEALELQAGSGEIFQAHFGEIPQGYRDLAGLCKAATIQEVEAQGWSLNPGRYVGVTERSDDGGDFRENLEALNEELEALNAEARALEEQIAENVVNLLGAD